MSDAVDELLPTWPTAEVAGAAWRDHGWIAVAADDDEAVGTNHVLTTSRAARYTGGLWVGKFLNTCTYQRLTAEGTRRVAPTVAAISHAEHFVGHALTAEVRLERVAQTTS